jgi:acetyl-CoA C-acetyltransferase
MMVDNRAMMPVIIGVGQVNDRPSDPFQGMDSRALMAAALKAAEADSGASVLGRLDWLGVEDQISFPDPDIHQHLAATLTPRPRYVVKTEDASGDGPVRLINDAANLVAEGKVRIAAAVGAEAMRTANKRAQIVAARAAASGNPPKIDKLVELAEASAKPMARKYQLLTPIDVYPLYENATRAFWGLSAAEAQAETAAIWSGFSMTANDNPNAWLHTPMSPGQLLEVTADNRMLSYPYTKLMVANNSVNQGAAVIVTSLAVARELGVAEDRIIYIGAGAASHEPDDFLLRDSYEHSASLTASIRKALEFNELTAENLDHVELYSCFPCVPKMARRVLNWPIEKPHSVYGGLTFGGGPIGNCMMHAAAAMVEKLRGGGQHGLIVSNGGYATHNHAIVLSHQAPQKPLHPQNYDVHTSADALRTGVPELLEHYAGPGTVETFVAPYGRDGRPTFVTIVARTPDGRRFLSIVTPDDTDILEDFVSGKGEPIGMQGIAEPIDGGRLRWRRGRMNRGHRV